MNDDLCMFIVVRILIRVICNRKKTLRLEFIILFPGTHIYAPSTIQHIYCVTHSYFHVQGRQFETEVRYTPNKNRNKI